MFKKLFPLIIALFLLTACDTTTSEPVEPEVVETKEAILIIHEPEPAPEPEPEQIIVSNEEIIVNEEPAPEPEIVEPAATSCNAIPLSEDVQDYIIEICEIHNIDPSIIIAMAERESTFNPNSIGDSGNAYGLLQIWPKWHSDRMAKLGVTDLLDPKQNVTVAVDYLVELLARYDDDIAKALTAYNAGFYKGTVTKYASSILESANEWRTVIYAAEG